MKLNKRLLTLNSDGELISNNYNAYTKTKFKPDSPFLGGAVPLIFMLICVAADIAFFINLFSHISYDSTALLVLEVACMAFTADVVAAYAGIIGKQISEGLSKDKIIFYMTIGIPILSLITNAYLRFTTIPLLSPTNTVDMKSTAQTFIAIVLPILTSLGNYAISYKTYDPLKYKLYQEELAIDQISDTIRRYVAMKQECDSFDVIKLINSDSKALVTAKMELINDAHKRLANAKLLLIASEGTPSSTNILSKSGFEALLNRIDTELHLLESKIDNYPKDSDKAVDTIIKLSDIA